LLTSAIMPTFMVVAVSPTSVPGAAAAGEDACVAGVDAGADGEVAAVDGVLLLLLLLLAELQPTASRTAAADATISPAKRVRLRVLCPVPPRPGRSLLGLTLVPSTTPLPVSFDPAKALRSPQ
jgi:hypothetical protein